MLPLPESHFERVRALFAGEHLSLVINAVIDGNSPGRLWVDDADQPRAALMWDGTHGFYVAGTAENAAFNRALAALFADEITPYALEQRLGIFKLYYATKAWERAAETLLASYAPRKLERVFYRFDGSTVAGLSDRIAPEFQVSSINGEFEALSKLKDFQLVIEEIEACWKALADFRARGFGMCAHDGAAVACWCTSEYVSGNRCGIGIETVEEYQRRGIATATASAFVAYCVERGITPHWDAWKHNTPSTKVAERVGFRKIEDYTIWLGSYDEK